MRSKIFNIAISLSICNFLFVKIWSDIGLLNISNFFFTAGVDKKLLLLSLISFIIFFFLFQISKSTKITSLFLNIFIIFETSFILKSLIQTNKLNSYIIFFISVIVLFFIFKKINCIIIYKFFGIIFFPFFLVVFFNFFYSIFFINSFENTNYQNESKIYKVFKTKENTSTILLVFDGVTKSILFNELNTKPTKFKNIKFILQYSNIYNNYFIPYEDTMHSIPSILLGKNIEQFEYFYKNKNININFFNKDNFKNTNFNDSLFDDFQKKDKTVYINGWYFPYCKLVTKYNSCFNNFFYHWFTSENRKSLTIVFENFLKLIPGYKNIFKNHHREYYEKNQSKKGVEASLHDFLKALDEGFDFYYYHINVPHYPFIFDTNKNNYFTDLANNTGTYEGNLQLADLILGKILYKLKINNKFDTTKIIITSDHRWIDGSEKFNKTIDKNTSILFIKNINQTKRNLIEKKILNSDLRSVINED